MSLRGLRNWLSRAGYALDVLLNVLLFGGSERETISLHAAQQARRNKRWACLLCRWLSLTVQRDHCASTIDGGGMTDGQRAKAGLQLLAIVVLSYILF